MISDGAVTGISYIACMLEKYGSSTVTSSSRLQAPPAAMQGIALQIDEGFLSAPAAVESPTEGGLTAFMHYYPPQNKVGLSAEKGLTLYKTHLPSESKLVCYVPNPPFKRWTRICELTAVHTSQDFKLPPGEKPPLLIKIHGGPTSQASTAFSLGIQYWTSRGKPTY